MAQATTAADAARGASAGLALPGEVLHFAYGSNMHPRQILARCRRPRAVAVARLTGHRLAFFGHADRLGGALETVVPAAGDAVWGVVYALVPTDAASLDAWQDARFDGNGAYFHYPVRVVAAAGPELDVLLYKKDLLGPPRRPGQAYLAHIIAAAEARSLPADYVARLREIAVSPSDALLPLSAGCGQPGLRSDTCSDCGSLVAPGAAYAPASRRG